MILVDPEDRPPKEVGPPDRLFIDHQYITIALKFLSRLYLRTLGQWLPTDLFSYRFPVSVKGVCLVDGKVVLVQNERREWDLPGGKLRRNESIEDCLQREFREELGIPVRIDALVGATRVRIKRLVPATVLVLMYRCHTQSSEEDLEISHENLGLGTFTLEDLHDIDLPETYRRSIQHLFADT